MKIKTAQITIRSNNIDEKLSKLENYNDFQNLEILDEPKFDKFKISVPIFLRGESVQFRIQCVITVKKKGGIIKVEIYSDILKPLIISFILGLGIGISSYFVYSSLNFSMFMFFYALLISIIMLFYPIKKQTRSRIKNWIRS